MIPTNGFPENRESAVVNSIIKDKKSFVEYIALILGDDYLFTLLEGSMLEKSGFSLVVRAAEEDWGFDMPTRADKWIR